MPDVLVQSPDRVVPALSATSDTPVIETPTPAPAPEPAPEPELAADAAPEADAPPEGDEPAEPAADQTARKPNTVGRRLSELTTDKKVAAAKLEAAEAHNARLEQLLQEALGKKAEPEPAPAPVQPPSPRPRRADYADPDTYDTAVDAWYVEQNTRALDTKLAEREQHERAERETQQRETQERTRAERMASATRSYNERVEAVAEKYPDYAEVVMADDVPFTDVIATAIVAADNGPDVAYHLARNREELTRIAGLVPVAQILEIGRLAASLSAPPRQRVTPTAAPPPISPLRRGTNAATPKSLEDIAAEGSMDDYAARRMPEIRTASRWQGLPSRNN